MINSVSSGNLPGPAPIYRLHEECDAAFFADLLDDKDHPLWERDRLEFKSVGIDIGSSTSHLMFSRLVLRRMGNALSSRFVVVSREVLWKSEVLLTPYLDQYRIDVRQLADFIDLAYQTAGFNPEEIDTGAVIITGEASRKENAAALTNLFSRQAGKFVCATAGPNLEALMAAYGSGAVRLSLEGNGDQTVMAVDVGGGTAKIAIVQAGVVRETAAINIGGRLIAWDEASRLTRIEGAALGIAEELGLELHLGKQVSEAEKEALAARLAAILFETLARGDLSTLAKKLLITPPLTYQGEIAALMFSGGVGEYIYGEETGDYRDLGRLLGGKIRERAKQPQFPMPLVPSEERIRATVIGASQYTVQVSGSTIFVSDKTLLPLKNLKVLFPRLEDDAGGPTSQSVTKAIRDAYVRFDMEEGQEPVALAFHWSYEPCYELLMSLSQGIAAALPETMAKEMPLVLVFNADIGKTMGRLLSEELKIASPVVSFDQVHLHDFDYIDIGEMVEKVEAVPIVVKSLVFGRQEEDSDRARQLKKRHRH